MAPKFKQQPKTPPKRGAGGRFKPVNYNSEIRKRLKRKRP